MLERRIGKLLLLVLPVAPVLYLLDLGPVAVFAAAAVGLIPLSGLLGQATEAIAARVGPRWGGLISATFGNAAELILGIVALSRGLVVVVKASITGSIIGNALLVLGLSLLVGGLRHRRQHFNRATVGLQATLLVVAAMGMTVPSVLCGMLGRETTVNLSEEVAGVFLVTYLLSLTFSLLRWDDEDPVAGPEKLGQSPSRGIGWSLAVLVGVTLCIGVLSELLAGAVEQARDQRLLTGWGISEVFLGVIVLATIGNAAENSTAIRMAYRNHADLALHIAIGSSLQIALLVMPLLVFASRSVGPDALDLHFTGLEILAVIASVIVVHLVASDGESHWMEGVLLLAVYLILALAFYHLPASGG